MERPFLSYPPLVRSSVIRVRVSGPANLLTGHPSYPTQVLEPSECDQLLTDTSAHGVPPSANFLMNWFHHNHQNCWSQRIGSTMQAPSSRAPTVPTSTLKQSPLNTGKPNRYQKKRRKWNSMAYIAPHQRVGVNVGPHPTVESQSTTTKTLPSQFECPTYETIHLLIKAFGTRTGPAALVEPGAVGSVATHRRGVERS